MQDNFLVTLQSASKALQIADHMIYITFPLIKENRLLIKILSEIHATLLSIINTVLQYEYGYKRIVLYNDARMNFNTFKDKCAPRFNISQDEVAKIIEIFRLVEKHKKSPMEFARKDKLVILSDNLHTETISIEKLKEYLFIAKNILQRVSERVKERG